MIVDGKLRFTGKVFEIYCLLMIPTFTTTDLILFFVSYLLGSIPFGLIIAKISGIGDLRSKGSGNIGATNVVRVGGKKLGAVVLLLDGAKAYLAVALAREYSSEETAIICALFSVLGHIFPIWLKFKGGKGVATTIGALLAIYWPIGAATVISWLLVFAVTRISSLSSITSMFLTATIPFFITLPYQEISYLCFSLGFLVIISHHANIKRLLCGEERKIK